MDSPKKPTRKKPPEAAEPGVLETAAKAIGSTLGAVAVTTGIVHPPAKAKAKVPKLVKKEKHRVPRKLKKEMRKQAAKKAS